MKLVKCSMLYDGTYKKEDCIVGFEEDKIKYGIEGRGRPSEEELGKNENNNMKKKKQEQS